MYFFTRNANLDVRIVTQSTNPHPSNYMVEWLATGDKFRDQNPYNAIIDCMRTKASNKFLYVAGVDCRFTQSQTPTPVVNGWCVFQYRQNTADTVFWFDTQKPFIAIHRNGGTGDGTVHAGDFEGILHAMIEADLS